MSIEVSSIDIVVEPKVTSVIVAPTGLKGDPGPIGPKGDKGDQGDPGEASLPDGIVLESELTPLLEEKADVSYVDTQLLLKADTADLDGFVSNTDPRLTDARTPLSHNQSWSTITATPTTLSGYGITDGVLNTDARLSDSRNPLTHNQPWSTITATPTTLAGYGITNAVNTSDSRLTDARVPLAHNQAWSTITGTPTSLSGYGITDAVSSTDSRLSDTRVPTDGSVTSAKLASGFTLPWSQVSSAPSFVTTSDSRLSDPRTPTDASVTTAKLAAGFSLPWGQVSGKPALAIENTNATFGDLTSNSYAMGLDFTIRPRAGGLSNIQNWGGIWLGGLAGDTIFESKTDALVGQYRACVFIKPSAPTIPLYGGSAVSATTLLVKQATWQTTGLSQEWQNSAGTTIASLTAAGLLTAASFKVGTGATVGAALTATKVISTPSTTDTITVTGAAVGDIVLLSRGTGGFVSATNTVQFDSTDLSGVTVRAVVLRFS